MFSNSSFLFGVLNPRSRDSVLPDFLRGHTRSRETFFLLARVIRYLPCTLVLWASGEAGKHDSMQGLTSLLYRFFASSIKQVNLRRLQVMSCHCISRDERETHKRSCLPCLRAKICLQAKKFRRNIAISKICRHNFYGFGVRKTWSYTWLE